MKQMTDQSQRQRREPVIETDLTFHLKRGTTFDYTYGDDEGSIGSSVQSGLRNSLHSSYDFSGEDLDFLGSDGDESFGNDVDESTVDVPSWRLNHEESMSDWSLTIESIPDGNVTTFNVHKCMLSSGKKKSDFFVNLFHLHNKKGIIENGSSMKVHVNASGLVPMMLDYMYSPTDDLEISTSNAVGLKHLSEFFGIRELAKRAVAFLYEDVSIWNVHSYILDAIAFDDLATQQLCCGVCAKNILKIDPYSDLIAGMDPNVLLDIISFPLDDRCRSSEHRSKIVAVYCELHRPTMNPSTFGELTTPEYLPIIGTESALELLLLESEFVDEAIDEDCPLTHLQERCVEALSPLIQYQAGTSQKMKDMKRQKLSQLPRKVLTELLAVSFCAPA